MRRRHGGASGFASSGALERSPDAISSAPPPSTLIHEMRPTYTAPGGTTPRRSRRFITFAIWQRLAKQLPDEVDDQHGDLLTMS